MFDPVESWEQPEGLETVVVSTTAYYAVQEPRAGVDGETRLLCALHGWGQNARSFLRRFGPLRGENILVVAPQGPHQFYLDRDTRRVGFSWLTAYDRNRAMGELVILLDAVLEEVQNTHGITGSPCVLGFSQGVSIAYRYKLLAGRPVRGIIACGGDLPPDVHGALSGAKPLDVFLVHGREDGIVPPARADEAEEILAAAGIQPTRFDFDGAHELPQEAVGVIGTWISGLP